MPRDEALNLERDRGVTLLLEAQRTRCEAHLLEDIFVALSRVHEQVAESVAIALARLDAGTFGYCLDCNTEIAARRLAASPLAIRCGHCEHAREIKLPSGI